MKFILETDDKNSLEIIKGLHDVKLVDIDKHTAWTGPNDSIKPELVFHNDERNGLCLAIEGQIIAGQRGLSINSNVNEVINVDVNFILCRGAFASLFDKTD